MKIFSTQFDIYFEDISPSGKVHLEKLAEWMSMAREQYLKNTCTDYLKLFEGSVKMFTTSMALTITGRSKWTDKIIVGLTSSSIRKISFEINANFTNTRTGEIIAKGIQKVIFVDTIANKFVDIPKDLKNNVVQYER
ncbi:MAG: acyl-CoA thioesterase [Candidatus Omnitrophica bacterium]|nr:acyl-CoA thioesterase [Candidatus Omnitrophota bacterium]